MQLAQAGVRARTHPADVVADLHQAVRQGAQLTGNLNQAVTVSLSLEVVTSLGQGQAGLLSKQLNHASGEAVGGVDAGTHSGTAQGNLSHARQGSVHTLNAVTHGCGVAGELLAQGDGGCVHQVGTARLHNVLELCGLALQGLSEHLESGNQVLHQSLGHSNVHGGGEDVVGGLGCVHVVIGVNLNTLRLQGTGCQGCQNLVRVHVRGGTGTGLENVNGEVGVVLTGCYQIRCVADSLGALSVEHLEFLIGGRGCLLHEGKRTNMGGFEGLTRNREVLDCALGLCTVKCISRNANFAHGVMFNAVFNVFSHTSSIGVQSGLRRLEKVSKEEKRS